MRLSRTIFAAPVAATALLIATAAPAGAVPSPCSISTNGCHTFSESGSSQSFTVPAGVLGVTADLLGAGGGTGYDSDGSSVPGGTGGQTVAALLTTPGATVQVVVGGAGGDATEPDPDVADSGSGSAGFNGGGPGTSNADAEDAGGGGGGATDLWSGPCAASLSCTTGANLVAGGGGGGAGSETGLVSGGGSGGGASGGSGSSPDLGVTTGGTGGNQSGPGAGGVNSDVSELNGNAGIGATGGSGDSGTYAGGGGGGGGGYYGGGGGANSDDNGGSGGGGGSGYLPAGAPGFTQEGGGSPGSGVATIYWMTAPTLTVTAGDSLTLTATAPTVTLAAAGGHSVTLDAESEGTETFTVGSTTLCSAVPVVDGTASCPTSALPVGTDDVTATLTGPEVVGSFTAPGSVTLTSHLVRSQASGSATLDQSLWDGTTEVLAVTVSAVPVPTSGAGIPAGVPPVAVLLILVGAAGIVSARRFRRAR